MGERTEYFCDWCEVTATSAQYERFRELPSSEIVCGDCSTLLEHAIAKIKHERDGVRRGEVFGNAQQGEGR